MSKRKKLIAKLDKKWSKAVIEKDGSTCQKCGRFAENPHHVFLKRYMGSRFLLKNGVNLCEYCHVPWAHARPEEFMEWWIDFVGMEVWEHVRMKAMELKVNIEGLEI